jgi:hypothetical protein
MPDFAYVRPLDNAFLKSFVCYIGLRTGFFTLAWNPASVAKSPPVRPNQPHEFETFDGGVGCFHRFKAPHRVYQVFELARINFDISFKYLTCRYTLSDRHFLSAFNLVMADLQRADGLGI